MSSLLDKLNLRPQERRLLVFVAIVTFVVLNIWLVWPHFKDWRITNAELQKTQETLRKYQAETARIGDYQARLRELEGSGPNVIPEEQDLDLVRNVQSQTLSSGIKVTRSDPKPKTSNSRTNQFFEEQTLTLRFEAGNEELVKFLVNLTSTNSLIRVQDLDVKPAGNRSKLSGGLTLVASYQKNKPLASVANSPVTNSAAVSSGASLTKDPLEAEAK